MTACWSSFGLVARAMWPDARPAGRRIRNVGKTAWGSVLVISARLASAWCFPPEQALTRRPTTAPVAQRYNDIWFVTPELGWAVNSNGQILKTADGGALAARRRRLGISLSAEGNHEWGSGEVNEQEVRELFFERLEHLSAEAGYELCRPDYVVEMPQSGERIRGRDKMPAFEEAYPNPPTITPRRVVGAGAGLAVAMGRIDRGTDSCRRTEHRMPGPQDRLLTLAEHGAAQLLVALAWRLEGGQLASSDRLLARLCAILPNDVAMASILLLHKVVHGVEPALRKQSAEVLGDLGRGDPGR
jgi:hypothetical protein